MRNNNLKSRKSQITIFIIIALIIVVAAALVFVLVRKPTISISPVENPQAYITGCAEKSLEAAEAEMINGNLYPNMTDNYIVYYGERVRYLCKSSQFYQPCINQEPMLVGYARNEMLKTIKPDVEKCFSNMKASFEKQGYSVSEGSGLDFELLFDDNRIILGISKKLIITRNEETRTFEKFETSMDSPLYKLMDTARNIVNFESTLCEFSEINWMEAYPAVSIKVFTANDQSKIYTLTDKKSEKNIKFAVKTCALPAGI